jgi:hypothetical protein
MTELDQAKSFAASSSKRKVPISTLEGSFGAASSDQTYKNEVMASLLTSKRTVRDLSLNILLIGKGRT